jgi:hypothetical protein
VVGPGALGVGDGNVHRAGGGFAGIGAGDAGDRKGVGGAGEAAGGGGHGFGGLGDGSNSSLRRTQSHVPGQGIRRQNSNFNPSWIKRGGDDPSMRPKFVETRSVTGNPKLA